jgi:hypothetical protein
MWKVLAESLEGTSHRRTSQPCQDWRHCLPVAVAGETILIVACADGAGSAELSDVGARLACEQFFDVARAALEQRTSLDDLDRATVLDWYHQVQAALRAEADRRGVAVRQLACTLLTAVIGEHRALLAQVGDGSIVYLDGERYQSAFWPQSGDYANTTNFITQDDLADVFEIVEKSQRIDELAAFTDGLQRLALSFASRSVYQPFFGPLFAPLRAAEHADELVVPLRAFLDSPLVNERTDDDKTLVLATRVPAP